MRETDVGGEVKEKRATRAVEGMRHRLGPSARQARPAPTPPQLPSTGTVTPLTCSRCYELRSYCISCELQACIAIPSQWPSAHLFRSNGNMNRNVLVICSFAGNAGHGPTLRSKVHTHHLRICPISFKFPFGVLKPPLKPVLMLFDSWKSFRYILG